MEKKYKLSEESAQEQIKLLSDMGLVNVEDVEPGAILHALLSSLNTLRSAIRVGALEIKVITKDNNKELQVVQYLTRIKEQSITYKEPDGQAMLYIGKIENDNNYERSYSLLGYLSGLGMDVFLKLRGLDKKIAECLSLVFLGV